MDIKKTIIYEDYSPKFNFLKEKIKNTNYDIYCSCIISINKIIYCLFCKNKKKELEIIKYNNRKKN